MDASLFVFKAGCDIIYFLVYVDDLILTRNNDKLLSAFLGKLYATFSLKDLGPLNYFLGIGVMNIKHGLFLSQQKYIIDMLEKYELQNAKPAATSMANST